MKTIQARLVRHGRTVANEEGVIAGLLDTPLTEGGRDELARIRDRGIHPMPEILYTSPLSRARDTASILFPGANQTVVPDIAEISFGSYEGRKLSSPGEGAAWFKVWVAGERQADEESFAEVRERARRALLRLAVETSEKGLSSFTAVTHSGFMRSAVVALFGLAPTSFRDFVAPNGGAYDITFSVDGAMAEPLSWEDVPLT